MFLKKIIKYLLLATALTPLIYVPSLAFPFVFGKVLFFRILVEIALIVFLVDKFILFQNSARQNIGKIDSRIPRCPKNENETYKVALWKNPLIIAIILFLISAAISSFFSIDPYRAFWGNLERGEGLFGLLHYLAFFIMAVSIFNKKDWLSFIKISLGVGFIVAFYGILQFLGVENFPFAFDTDISRAESFLGNAAFIGTHFLWMLIFAAMIFLDSAKKDFWCYFSLVMMVVSVLLIFLSETRGAMLALFVGGLLWLGYWVYKTWKSDFINVETSQDLRTCDVDSSSVESPKATGRKTSKFYLAISLVLIILIGGGFFLTRDNLIWQSIPGINRIASFSLHDPTAQTRLISLGVSWEAFKEKPIFGWGIDNFNIAYNKYYNPNYALYEEAWFDRAHNKLADVAVMQGLFGLLIYLGIFILAFYYLLKKVDFGISIPLTLGLVMYFIQNLFVFDQVNSHLIFFGVLGMVVAWTKTSDVYLPAANSFPLSAKVNESSLVMRIIFATSGVLVLFYFLYVYNYIPYRQAEDLIWAQTESRGDAILIEKKMEKFLNPYNFSQYTIRSLFNDFLISKSAYRNKELNFLTNKSLKAMEELAEREPYEPRTFIRLAETYNDIAKKGDTKILEKSEAVLRKALKLSPNKQDIYYHLAYALVSQGNDKKNEEAIMVARRAVRLSPGVRRAHYILGIILSLAGDKYRNEGQKEIEIGLNRNVGGGALLSQDYKNLETIFSANLIFNVKRKDVARIIHIIKMFKEIKPAMTKELDVVAGLAAQEKWEELNRLLGI